jgi:TRAP-type C4-dicarboxylate transport system permease small subunit
MSKKVFLVAWLVALLFPFSALLAQTDNSSLNEALSGLNATAGQVGAFKDQTSQTNIGTDFLTTKAGQIIGLVLSFVGVIFLVLMIYAGILWMTASGNEQQTTKAKDLIISAVIGIIIVFAAYAITNFIGTAVMNTSAVL